MVKNYNEVLYNNETIKTERLTLRKFLMEDAEDILEYAGDAETAKFLKWEGFHTLGEAKADICDSYWSRPGIWAVELAESGKMIGDIILRLIHDHDKAKIGYLLNRQYWRKSYAAEAMRAVMRLCFEGLAVNRVEGDHFAGNEASGRVMEKCGMVREAVKLQGALVKGVFMDVVYYGITKEDYYGKKLQ